MILKNLLHVYKKGSYILSDGKRLLDKYDERYQTCEVIGFSNYRYHTIRIVIKT